MNPITSSPNNQFFSIPTGSAQAETLAIQALRKKGTPFQPDGLTALEIAIRLKDLVLCQQVVKLQGGLDQEKPFAEALLHLAMTIESEEIALWLIEEGVDIFKEEVSSKLNYLHLAASKGMCCIAEKLVQGGMPLDKVTLQPCPNLPLPPNYPNKVVLEWTALSIAVSAGQTQMVEWLLKKGANQTPGQDYDSPFILACFGTAEKMMDLFVTHGFVVDQATLFGEPILHAFVVSKNIQIVKKLLELKVNPNSQNDEGNTPLHLAHALDLKEISSLLLDSPNIDLEIENKKGETAIAFTILNRSKYDVCQMLLNAGVNLNHQDYEGRTALHHAVLLESIPFTKMLLENGAGVNIRDKEGNTPLYYARHEAIIEILLRWGAEVRILNAKGLSPLGCIEKRSFSNPEAVFTTLQQLDGGLTHLARELRLFGHRFSLKGEHFEGFNSADTYRAMAISLKALAPSMSKEIKNKWEDLSICFTSAAALYPVDMKAVTALKPCFDRRKLLFLPIGTPTHAVMLAMQYPFIIKANRGGGSGDDPGLTLYRINDAEKAFQGLCALIEVFSKRVNMAETKPSLWGQVQSEYDAQALIHFNETMVEEMGLTFVHHERLKDQKTGLCSWMSAKMAFRAALILGFLEEGLDVNAALLEAKTVYRKWAKRDYAFGLESLPHLIQEPLITKQIDLSDAVSKIFSKCIEKKNYSLLRQLLFLVPGLITYRDQEQLRALPDMFQLATVQNEAGDSLLHLLISKRSDYKSDKILEIVLERLSGEDIAAALSLQNEKGMTPMHLLFDTPIDYEANKWASKILKKTTHLDFLKITDNEGNQILHYLMRAPGVYFSSFMKKLKKRASSTFHTLLFEKNKAGSTPLHLLFKSKTNYLPLFFNIALTGAHHMKLATADADGNTILHLLNQLEVESHIISSLFQTVLATAEKMEIEKAFKTINRDGTTPLLLLLKRPLNWHVCELAAMFMTLYPNANFFLQIDNEGNNLLHLLSLQSTNTFTPSMIACIGNLAGPLMADLLAQKNSNGHNPIDLWNLNQMS